MAFRTDTLEQFVESVAARTPVPGGGAVAAVTAAHGAALAAMVLEFTLGKPRFAEFEQQNREALAQLARMRHRALELADEDAQAYGELNSLWKLPKDSPVRLQAWDGAVAAAIRAPQAILDLAAELACICAALRMRTNAQLASDLAIAADLSRVAARAAAHNVAVNLPSVADAPRREAFQRAMDQALRTAESGAQPV
ncbi:MAG: cyclodeaminase/cyclohydrolase family protein [Phycisphaerales bacterium]